ncbi:StAR-related lipid transfer protein 10 [Sarotherodon galilaeus]
MEQRWLPGIVGYGGPPGLRLPCEGAWKDPGPLLHPGSWMVCRPTLSPVSWILGAGGVATSTWWIGKATAWRTGPGSLGWPSWTSACCGSSIACIRVSLVGRREAPVEGGVLSWQHVFCCFFALPLSLSLSLTCRGGAHYGLPPLAHAPAISTPAAYLGEHKAYLRRQHCVTRRWIVELSASVTLPFCVQIYPGPFPACLLPGGRVSGFVLPRCGERREIRWSVSDFRPSPHMPRSPGPPSPPSRRRWESCFQTCLLPRFTCSMQRPRRRMATVRTDTRMRHKPTRGRRTGTM